MGAGGGVSSAGVGFRSESAPTVLDMSPEGSVLSRPPSVAGRDEEHMGGHFVNSNGDENGKNARFLNKMEPEVQVTSTKDLNRSGGK